MARRPSPTRKGAYQPQSHHMKTLLQSLGLYPFQSQSGYPLADAQRNLSGKTHYVDDDTLRGFRAKITDAGIAHGGLTYWIIESVRSKPSDIPGGHFRFVAFDVDGSVLTTRDVWHRSTAAAHKHGVAWLASHDATAHTRALLATRAARAKREAEQIEAFMS